MRRIIFSILVIISIVEMHAMVSGCAQILAPTGGPRDTLPPKLINANPKNKSTNFTGNHITLTFDEYVHTEEVLQNLLVSPTPKINPIVNYKLRTVSIKLKDTLQPNTTYTIDLGNSIRDLNENNAIKNFTYVFSTGATIDSLSFSGNVQLAETGKYDSTIIAMLYKNLNDSAVIKQKPNYIARIDGKGNFTFQNLAAGKYKVYALKDDDGTKIYDSKIKIFAFADNPVQVSENTAPVALYAYAEEKEKRKPEKNNTEKKLRYFTRITSEKQNILNDLVLDFNHPLKNVDTQKILLTDTLNNVLKNVIIQTDSTNKKIIIKNKWIENTDYKLIISKDFATDTLGNSLVKSDTIKFKTRSESNYGTVKLTFKNFDINKNPVLQFVVDNEVVYSYPLTSATWEATLFNPGEYEIRILFDENKNGKWDPGNFAEKKQPERVFAVQKKLAVHENFENDVDIELPK